MKDKFNSYDIIGIVAPGTVLMCGLYFLFWLPQKQVPSSILSFGDFGIFIILAFVAGHLVQAFGNIFEAVYWFPQGGRPTNKVLPRRQNLLTFSQISRLQEKVANDFKVDLDTVTQKEWEFTTLEIQNLILGQPGFERVATFNQTYGLMRGVFASLLLMALLIFIFHWNDWPYGLCLCFFACVALFRMHRFAYHYSRALMTVYLCKPKA